MFLPWFLGQEKEILKCPVAVRSSSHSDKSEAGNIPVHHQLAANDRVTEGLGPRWIHAPCIAFPSSCCQGLETRPWIEALNLHSQFRAGASSSRPVSQHSNTICPPKSSWNQAQPPLEVQTQAGEMPWKRRVETDWFRAVS